jgi:hypothetical protein
MKKENSEMRKQISDPKRTVKQNCIDINELISIDIIQTKYDTKKQIDKVTKKYPVSEETKTTVKKNMDMHEIDSIHHEIKYMSVIEFSDSLDINAVIKFETKEETNFVLEPISCLFEKLDNICRFTLQLRWLSGLIVEWIIRYKSITNTCHVQILAFLE